MVSSTEGKLGLLVPKLLKISRWLVRLRSYWSLKATRYLQRLYVHELLLIWQSKSVLEPQFYPLNYSIPWNIQTFSSNIIITNLKQLDIYQVWAAAFFFFFFNFLLLEAFSKVKMLELHLWKWKFKGSPFVMAVSKLDMYFQVCSLNIASISHLGSLKSVISACVSKCNTGSCMFSYNYFIV